MEQLGIMTRAARRGMWLVVVEEGLGRTGDGAVVGCVFGFGESGWTGRGMVVAGGHGSGGVRGIGACGRCA